ncbi:hypothetical protein BH09ACT11_BH09ACT11_17550 [soil metagenome]
MPTYQYACTECGHGFEQYQAFSEDALTICPECGGRLRKVFNSVGVTFKGSGFYRTDSRSGSSGTDAAAGSTESTTGAATTSPGSTPSSGSTTSPGSTTSSGPGGSD